MATLKEIEKNYDKIRVDDILSYRSHAEQKHISVKLDYKDIRNLKKTITVMKSDLSAYPSGDELARIAGMSPRTLSVSIPKIFRNNSI